MMHDVWIENSGHKRSTDFIVVFILSIVSIPFIYISLVYFISGETFLNNIYLGAFSLIASGLILIFCPVVLYVLFKDKTYVKLIFYQVEKQIPVDDMTKYVEKFLTSKSIEFELIIDKEKTSFYRRHSFQVEINPKKDQRSVDYIWLRDISGENDLILGVLKNELIYQFGLSIDTRKLGEL